MSVKGEMLSHIRYVIVPGIESSGTEGLFQTTQTKQTVPPPSAPTYTPFSLSHSISEISADQLLT